MKKIISYSFAIMISTSLAFAQNSYTAKKDMTLKFKGEDGTNASAVVWNPDKHVYYSVIAGNGDFPLETFSQSGNVQYTATAGVDTRGIWYNASTGKLEGNGYGDVGYFNCNLNASGEPRAAEVTYIGQNQPDGNCVAAFDGKKVYFYYEGKIYSYSTKGKAGKSFEAQNLPAGISVLNTTTVVYTGRKGEEFGLLDYDAKRVYLLDKKGKYKAFVILPSSAVTHDMFRFSFSNGNIWLYDVDTRSWTGFSF